MTEIPVNPGNNDMQEGKQVAVQRIYIKDCSFESPRAPAVFSGPIEPEVKVNMRSDTNKLENDAYEVVLTITLEAQSENRSVFLVEVHQAGLFSIRGFNEQELGALLGSYCPNLLFAYAREAVSDLVQKGGMPVILLQPVNFDAIYLHSIAKANNPSGDASIPA
jgi:preprotein translocase subunit SecB